MDRTVMASMFIAAGLLVGLIIAVIIVKICNTNGKFKTDYDERQKIMIGKSYKCAMITTWVLLAIWMIVDMGGNKLPVENSVLAFSVIFVSVMVHASYSVWTDAYFGGNSNNKRYAIMSIVITLINLAAAVRYFMDGSIIIDGVLTFRVVNAECALMFLILGIEFWIKSIVDKKENMQEDGDEES